MRILFLVLIFGLNAMEAPYGSWVSSINADLIVKEAVKLGGGKEVGGSIYFSEMRPAERGRTALVKLTPEGKFEELIPSEMNARTRVHEYGGGSILIDGKTIEPVAKPQFRPKPALLPPDSVPAQTAYDQSNMSVCAEREPAPKSSNLCKKASFATGSIYFSNFEDQQLYKRDEKGKVTQLTHEKDSRFADGCAFGKFLFYVMEEHGKTVENCLVVIDPNGKVRRIAEGADFYSGPKVSPDGKQLAYYCWNHPNMPWDGGELRVAELKEDGTLGETQVVAGGVDESICQHAWGPDGRLYCTSDVSGWWNLYCEGKALYPIEADIGSPQWIFGRSFFDFWGDQIVFTYTQLGTDALAILKKGKLQKIELPFTTIKNISVAGDHLYFVGASPQIPDSLIQYNLKSGKMKTIKKSEDPIPSDCISEPFAIEFPTSDNLTAHAFYYPPKNPRFKGIEGERPPLLVLSHGGPTGHEAPRYDLEIQYWTSRGIAVIDVNYGGSSGYGRAYRDRLKGNWGIVDIDDCTNAALYCAERGLADRDRLCIAGGSAGGYTTLACLAFRDVFRAGASFFGVSDLEALALDTHKFESRYLDSLIGPYPARKDLYSERSPIHHVDQIKCPIILLQGDEDKIVPPPQSEKMYKSLLHRGIPTAYLLFEKEQHGFRQAANIKRSIEAEAYFFSKICGFELADKIEPVEIANLDE